MSPNPLDIAVPASTSHLGGVAPDSIPTTGKVVQSLGSDSYITKTTELVYEPRKDTDTNLSVTGVSIAAQHRGFQSPAPASPISSTSPPESPLPVGKDMSASTFIDKWFIAVHSSNGPSPPVLDPGILGKPPPSQVSSHQMRRPSTGTPTRSIRKKVFALMPPSKSAKPSIYNPDSWKPPEAWNCPVDKPTSAPKQPHRFAEPAAAASSVSLDLDAMKKEIKKMASACPQSILVKLNEEWGTAADAGFYKKLEMERKRWMLSALNTLHDDSNPGDTIDIPAPDEQKILALFESQCRLSSFQSAQFCL